MRRSLLVAATAAVALAGFGAAGLADTPSGHGASARGPELTLPTVTTLVTLPVQTTTQDTTTSATTTSFTTTAATTAPTTTAGMTSTSSRPLTLPSPKKPKLPTTGPVTLGASLFLAPRSRTRGCLRGASPDRRCSPGGYYSGLTQPVICSSRFRTSDLSGVSASVQRAVEVEYGLTPKACGARLEIDRIIPAGLGGSNEIANLFPEQAAPPGRAPGYRVKDRLESKLRALVCSGGMSLRLAQRGIASDWQGLYKLVFGAAPVG